MAKKKVKAPSSRKKNVAVPVAAPKVVEPVKKPNNMMAIMLAVVIVFVVAEIYFVTVKTIRQSKRPFYVNSWIHNYKGCTSIGEYGNYIYAIDNTRGDVYKTDKVSGQLEKILSFPEGVYSALENSKGELYILTKSNEVFLVDGKTYKTIKKIKPEGITDSIWMEIDSKDNFFIVSPTSSTVVKYGPDFNKLLVFGGRGDDKQNLSGIGKVFAGPKDELYVMNSYKPGFMEVKVFDNNGKFLRAWPINNIKKFDALTNMAVAPDGNVYINAYEESKIYVFSGTGKFLGSFDGDKDKRFQIVYAASITGGKNGLIYIHTHKLVVFKTINY
jgi:hypothetical protein